MVIITIIIILLSVLAEVVIIKTMSVDKKVEKFGKSYEMGQLLWETVNTELPPNSATPLLCMHWGEMKTYGHMKTRT
jgi:hypothetical protein